MPTERGCWCVVPGVAARPAGYLKRWILRFLVSLVLNGHFGPGGWSLVFSAGVSALFVVGEFRNGRRES